MKRIAVFGAASAKAQSIVVELAKNGLSVVATDEKFGDDKALEKARDKLWQNMFWACQSKSEAESAYSKIEWLKINDYALKAYVLNSNAIIETSGAESVYGEIEALANLETPIFTSAAATEMKKIAKELKNSERFMGINFLMPIAKTNFAEAVYHRCTIVLTQVRAMELARKIKKELRFVTDFSQHTADIENDKKINPAEITYLSDSVVKISFGDGGLNLLSLETVHDLTNKVQELKNRKNEEGAPRAIVIEGRGNNFSAGADIKEFALALKDEGSAKKMQNAFGVLMDAVDNMRCFVFAMIKGMAFGGGYELALACDYIIAEEESIVGLPEVGLGILPGAGGTQRLPRKVGIKRAMKMIVGGEKILAAKPWVDFIVKNGEKPDISKFDLSRSVADKSPRSQSDIAAYAFHLLKIELAKKFEPFPASAELALKAIWKGKKKNLASGLSEEWEAMIKALKTEDAEKGIRAFVEKRKPHFQGK